MKKLLLGLVLTGAVMLGVGSASEVNAKCITVRIDCGNGNGTNLITCGTAAEMAEDVQVMIEVYCQ